MPFGVSVMILRYALLGLLSDEPASGYDLKKKITDSSILYWSGNNQQVYRTLIQLEQEGLVSHQVFAQEHLPAKKVYSLTEQGLTELKVWIRSTPELPATRTPFLIQLTWAGLLNDEELYRLLEKYEGEVREELAMQQEKARRLGLASQGTSSRSAFLRGKITENVLSFYGNELNWIRRLRRDIDAAGGYQDELRSQAS